MNDFMRDLAKRKRVVAVGETVPKDLLLQDEEDKTQSDPHIWMDPSLWSRSVNAVRDAMIAARPQARAAFEANAARHLKEIEAVAAYARQVLATVPQERRAVISAHDAFGYFGRLHGFDVIGIQGISTESEAGVAKIRELVELTVSRKIPAIFVETSVSDRNVQAVIEGAKARGHALKIGGELFSDALGAAGAYEGTYIGMVDHNATVIARALGGQAPARGMNGKLAEPGS
jgi:manganese/zinc/iron transport system substrate-binding protein